MVERGVSLARTLYAFNSVNTEGWALYAEAEMLPYEPLEGQLIALQFRLLRAARAMMDPMIKSVVTNGGYIPEQCCPSPTHGYPTALGISIPPDKAGDMEYISTENRRVIAEHHMTGHFATWPVPEVMLSIRAMTDLLVDSVEGKADYKDQATVKKYMESLSAGHAITMTKYDEKKGNSYLFLVSDIYY